MFSKAIPTEKGQSLSKRLLSINEAMLYIGLGRSAAMKYLDAIGAKVKIGGRVLYDKAVIDEMIAKGGINNG